MTISQRFNRLADEWERETVNLSASNRIIGHPAVAKIIAMGMPVVPLIFKRMTTDFWIWFGVLPQITGQNPVDSSMYGDQQKIVDAWLRWGRENKLIQ